MPYVSVIRVSENCINIYHSWFKVSNSNTLNELSNTSSYSLVVQLTEKKKLCMIDMKLSHFVDVIKISSFNHISYCEQIPILKLFKINVFLYERMFFIF